MVQLARIRPQILFFDTFQMQQFIQPIFGWMQPFGKFWLRTCQHVYKICSNAVTILMFSHGKVCWLCRALQKYSQLKGIKASVEFIYVKALVCDKIL